MQTNLEPTNRSHRILVLVVTIFLTAGAVGGGVYYVLNQQNKAQDKLIAEMQKQNATNAEAKTEGNNEVKETNATKEEAEKVVETFLNEYLYGTETRVLNPLYLTSTFKKKIESEQESAPVDLVTFAQNTPEQSKGITIINSASNGLTAAVMVTFNFEPPHTVQYDLIIEKGVWKINDNKALDN